jgi:hypothetical protein
MVPLMKNHEQGRGTAGFLSIPIGISPIEDLYHLKKA